jgi:glycosyltransferase involved in cell wall biosynthesis
MKKKVLYILHNISSGGVENRRLSLIKYLCSKYEIKIVCTEAKGYIANKIREFDVEIIEIGRFDSVFSIKQHIKVQKIISEFSPDIIHGAVFEGVTLASLNGFIKRVPVIIIEETSDPQNRSWLGNLLMKIFSIVSDKVVAISPNVSDYLIKKAKISKQKVVIINNGVAIPREVSVHEVSELKFKFNLKIDDFIIGSVGRLHNDHKKFTDILEAIKIISDKRVKLLIVGSGNDEEMIKTKAKELGLENNLIMVGYQFDTAPFYKMMDVFCLASQREGFGLVAAEAMLHKLPVLATKVGGLQNVIVNDLTGFLVAPNSPNELFDKLMRFIENKDLRNQMGQEGYDRAIALYTEKRYVNDVENLYLGLLDKQNGS